MSPNVIAENPEPVPAATQLAIMPFLAAVQGVLTTSGSVPKLRITIHRAMARQGFGYLQQVSGYLPISAGNWLKSAGRLFPVDAGLIGKAYSEKKICRTKEYSSEAALLDALKRSMTNVGDNRSVEEVAKSYLVVPFVGPADQAVLLLYADCHGVNFFADNERVRQIVAMCHGFCDLFDSLQKSPFPNLRNFPLQPGVPVTDVPTVYDIQETFEAPCPRFQFVSSFNYEASVA